jgi:hypothetical protein
MALLPKIRTNSMRSMMPVVRGASHSPGIAGVVASGGLECSLCHLACDAIGDAAGRAACHIACEQLVC